MPFAFSGVLINTQIELTMKTLKTFFLLIFFATAVSAQNESDTTYWKISCQASVNFSQVSFSNWVGGGKNSVSGVGLFDMNALYEKDKMQWNNTLKAGYGLLKEEKDEMVKTDDKLELNSKLGVQLKNEHLLYSTFINF